MARHSPEKTRILAVDDDPFVLDLYRLPLEKEGFFVIAAQGGEEALRLAMKERPDVILLDILMPTMDGFEVLRRLKAEEQTADIPVVILTSMKHEGDIKRALNAGAVAYLMKDETLPSQAPELIRKAIASRRASGDAKG